MLSAVHGYVQYMHRRSYCAGSLALPLPLSLPAAARPITYQLLLAINPSVHHPYKSAPIPRTPPSTIQIDRAPLLATKLLVSCPSLAWSIYTAQAS